MKDKKEQILADFRAEIQKHEFQADSDRRSIQELNGTIESQRREIDHALAGDEQLQRDQLLLHEQLSEQNRDLREAHMKGLNEIEEFKRFQGSTFDGLSRRKLNEDEDTILELQTFGTRMVYREAKTRLGRKLSLNCLFAGRNNNNFDLCRPPGN